MAMLQTNKKAAEILKAAVPALRSFETNTLGRLRNTLLTPFYLLLTI